jgi:hypothetical protein
MIVTPQMIKNFILEELGFGEGTPAKDTWSKKKVYIAEEGSEQLEFPGMESPALCEPADGVDDLSSQLAQMVVDSGTPPEDLNGLMELIYDKVAANLEGIGIEDEEESGEYRRTTMGFMEALKEATLEEIMDPLDIGPTGTISMYADEPEEGPAATIKTEPVKDAYTESKRLFDRFFGKYGNDAPDAVGNELLKKIILQLYGWGLPEYRRFYDEPGTTSVKIAQEFETEGKEIEGNEEEFRSRVEKFENEAAKIEFDKNIAHRQPARGVKASPSHAQKALAKWAQRARGSDRGRAFAAAPSTEKLEEMVLEELEDELKEREKKQPSEKSAKKAERALRKTAKNKFPGDKERQNRYIYGGKRNIGWKPKRER